MDRVKDQAPGSFALDTRFRVGSQGSSRRLGDRCLSDLMLDQLRLGEVADAATKGTRAHLAECTACGATLTRLENDAQLYAQENLAHVAARTLAAFESAEPRSDRAWWQRLKQPWVASLAVASAAALMMVVGLPDAQNSNPAGDTRAKGAGFSLSTYVQRRASQDDNAATATLHMGTPLAPGDRIAFRVTSDRAGYLAIISVDSRAQVSVYYPPGDVTEAIAVGRELPLSTSVELDESVGPEVVIGVRCEKSVSVQSVVDAARAASEEAVVAGRAAPDLGRLALPCTQTRVALTKIARPSDGVLAEPAEPAADPR